MKPEFLMIAGAGLLAYWLFTKDDAPAATTPGANTTGTPPSSTGTTPPPATGGTPAPNQTGGNPVVLTKAQKLAAAAGGNSQNADVWNYYYKQLFDPDNAQPEPESYLGTTARDAKFTAEQYLQMRGLSGVGYIYRRRYIN